LLEAGADANATNSWGGTALHLAIRGKNPAAAEMLLHGSVCGANVADNHGMTPLHYAAQVGCVDSLRLLLDSQANVNVESTLCESPLSLAVHADCSEAVSMLLHAGAPIGCLKQILGQLSGALKETVERYVQRQSLAAAASMRTLAARRSYGGRELRLCPDLVYCVLARVFHAEEEFIRLLLNTEAEGCEC
jgi:hypothetical protein